MMASPNRQANMGAVQPSLSDMFHSNLPPPLPDSNPPSQSEYISVKKSYFDYLLNISVRYRLLRNRLALQSINLRGPPNLIESTALNNGANEVSEGNDRDGPSVQVPTTDLQPNLLDAYMADINAPPSVEFTHGNGVVDQPYSQFRAHNSQTYDSQSSNNIHGSQTFSGQMLNNQTVSSQPGDPRYTIQPSGNQSYGNQAVNNESLSNHSNGSYLYANPISGTQSTGGDLYGSQIQNYRTQSGQLSGNQRSTSQPFTGQLSLAQLLSNHPSVSQLPVDQPFSPLSISQLFTNQLSVTQPSVNQAPVHQPSDNQHLENQSSAQETFTHDTSTPHLSANKSATDQLSVDHSSGNETNGNEASDKHVDSIAATSNQKNSYSKESPGKIQLVCCRTVKLVNLPEGTTFEDITKEVRGGPIANLEMTSEEHFAYLSFVHEADTEAFVGHTKEYGLHIKGRLVKLCPVFPRQQHFKMNDAAAASAARGGTRNFVIQRCHPNVTKDSLQRDLDHIFGLMVIKIELVKGDCFVETNSIHNAMYARTCLKSQELYRMCRIEFIADDCARPFVKAPVAKPRKAPAAPVPAPALAAQPTAAIPTANRFQRLAFRDDRRDENEEDDEIFVPTLH